MDKPFFDFSDCPDAAGLPVPPAIPTDPVVADCSIPEAPDPVFQCRPLEIPDPGLVGSQIIHIQVVARVGLKHDWIAVDSDGAGGWVANGLAGSAATNSEAYELNGGQVDPGAAVYSAKRADASDKLDFWVNPTAFSAIDNFRFIRLTAGPDSSGVFDWKEVAADDWHDTGVTGTAAGSDGAYESTDFRPILDDTVYQARRAATGKYVFTAPRRLYEIRLPAGPDGSGNYDWAAYAQDDTGAWVATGFAGTAAAGHGAAEINGQVVKSGTVATYTARQNGRGAMVFSAPQVPFWIRLTAGPTAGLYDWEEVRDDGSGAWAPPTPAVTGTQAAGDGARDIQGLPAIPGDGNVYLARRSRNGQVIFDARDANSGYAVVAPSGGIAAYTSGTMPTADCQIVSLAGGTKTLLSQTVTVSNPYPQVMGLNSSLARPMQCKIIQGRVIPDVDPCAS